jgi:DNA-binding PadR family transcriptional regulator
MLDPPQGSTPPQPVKRYELTPEGKKYFQELPNPLGQASAFCYG